MDRSVVYSSLVVLLWALLSGCGQTGPSLDESSASSAAQDPETDWFVEVQASVGLDFEHVHGGSGERFLIESMGGGGGFLDFDGDGWLDIYFVQSGPLPGYPDPTPLPNQLFRNRGDGTFEDVTEASGAGDTGYGNGNCFGDIDNDGSVDIFVTNFGPDVMLVNRGDGTFEDVTLQSGIRSPGWSSSCAFADYDRDGWLDLYVVYYLDFTLRTHRRCGSRDIPLYCHPDIYPGAPDRLFRNRGDGTFEDVSKAAGIQVLDPRESKGLGVVWTDTDNDGWIDLYVANDSTRNFLFRNRGDGTFDEIGTVSGTAFNEAGLTEAGMGIAVGDADGDGLQDLFVCHLDFETNTLYRNLGRNLFLDATATAGLGGPSLPYVCFGNEFLDLDLDGDLDLFAANGHILDNVAQHRPGSMYPQPNQLFRNRGTGRFDDVSNAAGEHFQQAHVSRGTAAGDFDNDGDLDLLVLNCGEPPVLLRNDFGVSDAGAAGHWLQLRLLSRHGGRDAIGAQVRLVAGDLVRVAEVRAGSSYQSQGDTRLHFGLGTQNQIDRLEIRWPEGETEVIPGESLRVDRLEVLRQPE